MTKPHFCHGLWKWLAGLALMFLFAKAAMGQTAIAPGETKTNQSLSVGQQTVFTFTAAAGQRATIQMSYASGGSFYPTFDLISPAGTVLRTVEGGFQGTALLQLFALSGAGTYSIVCREADGTRAGNYGLSLLLHADANAADNEAGAIAAGQTRNAALTAGDLDAFTFTAAAGQRATIQMSYASGGSFYPTFDLISPAGAVLRTVEGGFQGNALLQLFALSTAGTYTIVCREADGTRAGNYGLTLLLHPDANVADNDAGTIAAGQTRNAAITVSDLDAFTFTAAAGQRATIQMSYVSGGSFYPTFDLISPAGAVLRTVEGGFQGNALLQNLALTNTGTFVIQCRESDGTRTGSYAVNLLLFGTGENRLPTITPPANPTVPELAEFTTTITATDPDTGQALTYSLDAGFPEGATINATTGVFSWTPTEAQGPGSYPITVRVTDNGTPPLSATATFTVTVTEVNQPPVLATGGDETIDELVPWSRVISATDADLPANTLTFELVSGPAGLSFNAATRTLSWTPSEAQGPGAYPVTVRVTDGTAPVEQAFTLTVRELNQPPVIFGVTAVPNPVSVGQPVQITVTASDSDLPAQALTYSFTGLPDNGTGVFTWTASGNGAVTLTARVSDGVAVVEQSVEITVAAATWDMSAQYSTANNPNGAWSYGRRWSPNDHGFDLMPHALHGSDNIFWLLGPGIWAPSITVGPTVWPDDNAQGYPTVRWTCPASGRYGVNARFIGADSRGVDTLVFVVVGGVPVFSSEIHAYQETKSFGDTIQLQAGDYVDFVVQRDERVPYADRNWTGISATISQLDSNSPPVLSVGNDELIEEGRAWNREIAASDPDASQVLTYALDVGFPEGATINATTGAFTWTPTEAQGPGSYPITVRVTDNGTPPQSATATFTVTVTEVNQPPVLAAGGDETIDEGVSWSRVISATDVDLPPNTLTFELVSGPAGLSFNAANRTLSWTPTEAQGPGTYPVTVRVTDGTVAVEQTFTLAVRELNQLPVIAGITAVPNPVTVGQAVQVTVSASDPDLPAQPLTYGLTGLPDNATGSFTWVAAGSGEVTLTARVSDGTVTIERLVILTVQGTANTPPTLSAIPDQQWDGDNPPRWLPVTVGDLESAPGGLVLSATSSDAALVPDEFISFFGEGAERWVFVQPLPGVTGTVSITVRVTDGGGLFTEAAFTVRICPCLEPELDLELYAVLTVRGFPGRQYLIEFSEDMAEPKTWRPLATITLQASPQLFIDMTGPVRPKRFYRATLRPEGSPAPTPADDAAVRPLSR